MDAFLLADIVILIGLFLLSGLFSGSETALISLGRLRLAHAIEEGGKRGEALEIWRRDPNRLLTTILIINNIVNISASTVAAFMAVHLAELYDWNRAQLGTAVAAAVTIVIILFGEVTPKLLAIRFAEPLAGFIIRPLVLLDKLLSPLGRIIVAIANLFLRLSGQQPGTHVPVVTEEEITTLIKMGADAGVIEHNERKMLHGVISLGDMQVREVMVPRTDIEGIDADEDMDRIIQKIIEAGYSRMPVYRENLDHIIGVVYTKDIIAILQNRELIVLQDILRQPYFVPETKKVDELLREFQQGKIHMAIVVDEYGGTAGLATLEDLIEEIVGEIHDEYDVEEHPVEAVEENLWVADGQADVAEVNNALSVELPNQHDINTIGGLITDRLGRLPRRGEEMTLDDVHITILAASRHKIDRLQLRRLPAAPNILPEFPEA